MKNALLRSKEPLSSANINNFEQVYNLSLPSSYKELLLSFNGGVPEKNVFINSENDTFLIHTFFSILYGTNTLEQVLNALQIWEQVIPRELLPIADDPFGNTYCISLAQKDYGKIYIWLHDVGGEKAFVADSLNEFLENTITYEDWQQRQE